MSTALREFRARCFCNLLSHPNRSFPAAFCCGGYTVNPLPSTASVAAVRDSSGLIDGNEPVYKVTIEGIALKLDRFTSVGRDADISIYESVPLVSRKHLEVIANRNGDVWVRDTNSRVGTFINGKRLTNQTWVKLGLTDKLFFGGAIPIVIDRTLCQARSFPEAIFRSMIMPTGKIETARRDKLRSCKTTMNY
jgi:hypothetical protein